MSKKARRRPSWKKDNFWMPKGWCWTTASGYIHIWPKSIKKQLIELIKKEEE